ISMTSTRGFRTSPGSLTAIKAPAIETRTLTGNNFIILLKSTFLDLRNFMELVNDPNADASLLVPRAVAGDMPVARRAGMDIRPPPPTAASMQAAMKPSTMISSRTGSSNSTAQPTAMNRTHQSHLLHSFHKFLYFQAPSRSSDPNPH